MPFEVRATPCRAHHISISITKSRQVNDYNLIAGTNLNRIRPLVRVDSAFIGITG